ncbi:MULTISPECIES: hypothetical protein [Thiorhodovibrio]|uniref:hypothetical protein n=1 Tax=Thiorhodovibrio TaxID=61593 RepID=UPI001911DE89|nr:MULTISPECIES: hypothetical protein [Thiorhodovibrio]MBK5970883.1 hypothetical protein [Thiorhodovibrio winogradskyi]WPL11385.1 hypothetical protein Thiosp_01119 [Thiorhodovibrio litoralis]
MQQRTTAYNHRNRCRLAFSERWPVLALALAIAGVCLALSLPAVAEQQRSTGAAMAEAMTRMMDAMGFNGEDSPGDALSNGMRNPMSPDSPGWSFMMGQDNPMSERFGDPVRQFGMPDARRWFGDKDGPWQPTRLDGIWEGRTGGLLIVRGYRFRLYQPSAGFIDGLIQQRGDRIAMYNPANDTARPYEFALDRGRMVLRDAAGELFLYRRLWLEDEQQAEPFSQGRAEDAPR